MTVTKIHRKMKSVLRHILFITAAIAIVVGSCCLFANYSYDGGFISCVSLDSESNGRCQADGFLLSYDSNPKYEQYTQYNVPAYNSSESASYSTSVLRICNSLRQRTLQSVKLSVMTKSELLTKVPCRSFCMHLGAFPDRISDNSSHFIALRRLVI